MSKSGKPQVQTTTTTPDRAVTGEAFRLYSQMGGAANEQAKWSDEQRVAGLSPAQLQAGQGLAGLPGGAAQQGMHGAMQWMGNLQGLQSPQIQAALSRGAGPVQGAQVAAVNPYQAAQTDMSFLDPSRSQAGAATAAGPGSVADIAARTGAAGMGAYTNPYETQVIDQAVGDLDRARQLANVDTAAAAARSGAFGGSRHGLVEAETTRNFLEQAGKVASGARQQGFQFGAQMGQTDADRMLGAASANQNTAMGLQGMQMQANLQNAGLATQASLANAQNAYGLQGLQAQIAMGNTNALNQAGLANLDVAQQRAMANAGFGQEANIFSSGQLQGNQQFNAGQMQNAAAMNQQAWLANQGLQAQAAQGMGNLAQGYQGMQQDAFGALNNWGMQQQAVDQARADFGYGRGVESIYNRANILGMIPQGSTVRGVVPTQTNPMAGMAGGAMAGYGVGGLPGLAIGGGLGLLGSLFG